MSITYEEFFLWKEVVRMRDDGNIVKVTELSADPKER